MGAFLGWDANSSNISLHFPFEFVAPVPSIKENYSPGDVNKNIILHPALVVVGVGARSAGDRGFMAHGLSVRGK